MPPYVLLEATRAYVLGSADPSNITSPIGSITISPSAREISGRNPERQDHIIGPNAAPSFAGYFVARFDTDFISWGTANSGIIHADEHVRNDTSLSGYAIFPLQTKVVNVRIGVSFISVDQARINLDTEIPDGVSLETTAYNTRKAWAEKLDRIQLQGATEENKTTFYTAFYHTLQVNFASFAHKMHLTIVMTQYPYEQDEDGKYYSGYDDTVHEGRSYTGYSIWVCAP